MENSIPVWLTSLIASAKPIFDFLNKILALLFPSPSGTKIEQENKDTAEKEKEKEKKDGRPNW